MEPSKNKNNIYGTVRYILRSIMLTPEEKAVLDSLLAKQAADQAQAEAEAAAQALAQRNALIAEVQAAGYEGTGSLADFLKLLDKPEWFGPNWANQAMELQGNLDVFLDYFQRYKE